ncbi:hypothetical protein ACFPER_02550 [Agromyces aurantiacus]|uniref:Alpha/beta hydrolase n=1 Tax=Agromyces aurantiacus TaxID=165814 RepID=A0ABV9R0M4_9MICO|nr:hypothetical protein [Agromyces aurantiacus]MBM7505968.1 hypothetical protein [Agromyces aurantiacus]
MGESVEDDATEGADAGAAGAQAGTDGAAPGAARPAYHRQAVVVIHGMGEQRPVETLNAFSEVITNGEPFHSRPTRIRDAFESRVHVIPRSPEHDGVREPFDVQTDLYEYHWAYLMTGNRLDDLWPTFRRMMFPVTGIPMTVAALGFVVALAVGIAWASGYWAPPGGGAEASGWVLVGATVLGLGFVLGRSVPPGLLGLWVIVWLAAAALAYGFIAFPPLRDALGAPSVAEILVGSASAIAIVAYLISRVLPGWLVKSFVDVVRYLDTSPRSYEVRHAIRKGVVDLLDGLQSSGRYSRIIVVAHSLGSYVAYDAISYLWTVTGRAAPASADDLRRLEAAAGQLAEAWEPRPGRRRARRAWAALAGPRAEYRSAQRELWGRLRAADHPWLITDLVTFGSPMNFAEQLYTRDLGEFDRRVGRREIVTCPPSTEPRNPAPAGAAATAASQRPFSLLWRRRDGRRALHEAAPFALVRWTNLWYPARWGFFGDWFGGPLARLYGPGVEDVRLDRASGLSRIPGYAHGAYLLERRRARARGDFARPPGSFDAAFVEALDLASASWLPERPASPAPAAAGGRRH